MLEQSPKQPTPESNSTAPTAADDATAKIKRVTDDMTVDDKVTALMVVQSIILSDLARVVAAVNAQAANLELLRDWAQAQGFELPETDEAPVSEGPRSGLVRPDGAPATAG